MASVFAGQIDLRIAARRTNANALSTPAEDLAYAIALTLTDGTSADQAKYFYAQRLSMAGAAQTLDVYGSLTDGQGATLNFATIRAIYIKNRSAVAGEILSIGAAASNPLGGFLADAASDKLVLRPGGSVLLMAPTDGYTVTNSSADQLKLDPGIKTFDVDVIIIGT